MAAPDDILASLNPAQREAAQTVRGPVAILAGAGTGKTTTITHRIAYQVASGTFEPSALLAVTFTQKAAGELKDRLARLGVEGVEARTFHAAALSQLGRMWERSTGTPLPEVLDHKAPLIASLANALPPPHKFLPRRDLAGEIEWAKNRLIDADDYLGAIERSSHEPPIPAELMVRVYEGYERRKRSMDKLDFEDMLALAVRMFQEHPSVADEIRGRFAAFTVDEFQDVNPLQAALLDQWLGGRDEVCVVGDDYQTIYAFTGASPSYLLDFPQRYPNAHVVRLEENYRSTPQVLELANRLAPLLGGFDKRLRATRPDGVAPVVRGLPTQADEVAWILAETRRLHADGIPWEQMAILSRINARSEPFEEAFAAAGIPYQVRDGSFLRRPGPRSVLARLRREPDVAGAVVETVERVTEALGYTPGAQADSDDEATRQSDLARMRALAREYTHTQASAGSPVDPAEDTLAGFVADLPRRFSVEESGRGVQLLTYHRAKGLEFDAVFLPRLLDGELPFRSGRSVADPREERRLLYVGITRARHILALTWPADARAGRSPFVAEAAGRVEEPRPTAATAATVKSVKKGAPVTAPKDGPLFERLKAWRKERAKEDGVPAYVVFHDATLAAIAASKPPDERHLLSVIGVGPAKMEKYADEVLTIVREA